MHRKSSKPGVLEAAEQGEQLGKLDGFPDREARDHDHHAGREHPDVEKLLHGVVLGRVVMGEPETQRVFDRGDELIPPDRQQHAAEPAGYKSVRKIADAVDQQHPHPKKVPLEAVLGPMADSEHIGKMQPAEQHLVVVDFPSAADHHEHRRRIGPMHEADGQGMQFVHAGRWRDGGDGRHIDAPGPAQRRGRMERISRPALRKLSREAIASAVNLSWPEYTQASNSRVAM